MKEDAWDMAVDINLGAVIRITDRLLEDAVLRPGGRIICLSSVSGIAGNRGQTNYSASKAGIVGFVEALANKVAKKGITVNAICPGYTDTDIIRNSVAQIIEKTGRSEAEALSTFTNSNPQGRLIQPEEVASTVLWLCSEQARSITGQAISVSGGEVM